MNQYADCIFIEELRVNCIIGIHPWERVQTQPLIFDLQLYSDLQSAAQSDQIADTLNYASVCEQIISFCEQQNFELLESLCEALTTELFSQFAGLTALELKVSKPHAVKQAKGVGLKIYRQRP